MTRMLRRRRRTSNGVEIVGITRFLPVLVALAVVVAACTSTPERTPVPVAEPTVEPDAPAEVVVAPTPSVTPTSIPTLTDADLASITTVDATVAVTDAAGNQVAIHSLRHLDADLLVRPEDQVRIGPAVALDISMCRSGEFATAEAVSIEFAAVVESSEPLTSVAPIAGPVPVIAPPFDLPEPGACARGWLAVRTGVDLASVGRYVLAVARDEGTERHVYQWAGLPTDAPIDPTGQLFRRGELVTFNEGPLVGTTVELAGWAELIGAESPAGTRQVGVAVEVCPATEDWPEFGLFVEGWNLVPVADPADRLGADPLAPLTGACFADWLEFAVPLGQRPSGLSVSDGIDPRNGAAAWTLDGAAINPPAPDPAG